MLDGVVGGRNKSACLGIARGSRVLSCGELRDVSSDEWGHRKHFWGRQYAASREEQRTSGSAVRIEGATSTGCVRAAGERRRGSVLTADECGDRSRGLSAAPGHAANCVDRAAESRHADSISVRSIPRPCDGVRTAIADIRAKGRDRATRARSRRGDRNGLTCGESSGHIVRRDIVAGDVQRAGHGAGGRAADVLDSQGGRIMDMVPGDRGLVDHRLRRHWPAIASRRHC